MPNDNALPAGRQRRSTPPAAQILASARKAAGPTLRKVGRPSAYNTDLCEIVMALGIQGKSRAGIAAALHIDKATLGKWELEFPEFSVALARAKAYEQEHWETKGYKSLGRKHFQAQVWRTSMAARFKDDYSEQRGASAQDVVDLASAIGEVIGRRSPPSLPGDGAKVVDGQVVKDDAMPSAPDVVRAKR